MLPRGLNEEAGAVDVGVGETDRHLPVGGAEDVLYIEAEAHPAPHWVDCPQ